LEVAARIIILEAIAIISIMKHPRMIIKNKITKVKLIILKSACIITDTSAF
jgi:hypothetical protein